jgi:hypothetical protein
MAIGMRKKKRENQRIERRKRKKMKGNKSAGMARTEANNANEETIRRGTQMTTQMERNKAGREWKRRKPKMANKMEKMMTMRQIGADAF